MSKKKSSFGIIIILVVLFGVFYVYLGSGYGIKVSCDKNEILSFAKVSPTLMQIVQPIFCEVQYEVKVNNTIICNDKINIMNHNEGVLPCSVLKKHSEENIKINVIFYSSDGEFRANITKEMIFKK
jgi:hypothetical protein